MATRQIVFDDLDGSEGASTRFFAVGDDAYELDLNDANWTAFQKAVSGFVAKARPASKRKTATNGASDVDPTLVRKWATDNGKEVNTKGRLSAELVAEYKAAQAAS